MRQRCTRLPSLWCVYTCSFSHLVTTYHPSKPPLTTVLMTYSNCSKIVDLTPHCIEIMDALLRDLAVGCCIKEETGDPHSADYLMQHLVQRGNCACVLGGITTTWPCIMPHSSCHHLIIITYIILFSEPLNLALSHPYGIQMVCTGVWFLQVCLCMRDRMLSSCTTHIQVNECFHFSTFMSFLNFINILVTHTFVTQMHHIRSDIYLSQHM